MRLRDSLKISFITLRTNKMRSALTMLGIIIGVGSVILMMSIGRSAQNLIIGQIQSLGSNSIYIEPGSFDPKGGFGMEMALEEMTIKTLKLKDMEAIEKDPLVDMAYPMVYGTARAVYQNNDEKITFIGTTPEAYIMDDWHAVIGRDINEEEVKSMARVATLGYKIAGDLFGEEDPIGKTIRIKKTSFKVIGVMEERGMEMFQNYDEYVYIPVTTAQKLLLGIDHLNAITVRAINEDTVDRLMENIRFILRDTHNIYNPEGDLSRDDFKVMSQVEASNMMAQITGILTAFLSSIAAIALIVGGIGIMNIMLVSVTERTKEIGLRKAVGARNKDILNQFLLESITLTLIGGIIGFLGGTSISFIVAIVLSSVLNISWGFAVPVSAVVLAFGVAAIVGLVFGIYPAKKAAKLNPIEALRHE
ncbi:ABC transporter permease [Patescibacteria group bacterium]|nr:ABC transporter permease [Patescibacteria group bacterium]MBU4458428.1 ABC transporter permease [Patescibacteria group bacterium]MCG2696126.1 ABC transporter permease [Candidatus Portnoybacteria bacterium]